VNIVQFRPRRALGHSSPWRSKQLRLKIKACWEGGGKESGEREENQICVDLQTFRVDKGKGYRKSGPQKKYKRERILAVTHQTGSRRTSRTGGGSQRSKRKVPNSSGGKSGRGRPRAVSSPAAGLSANVCPEGDTLKPGEGKRS